VCLAYPLLRSQKTMPVRICC